ncbi:MAG: DEAD/DEAH box helicase [Betaproteobacteria bacterium]|nr:DEAD/DEAH box helicase [Betaproteobacteria bacterium]
MNFEAELSSAQSDLNSEPVAPAPNGFAALGLNASLVSAVENLGFTWPTPVQAAAIPAALSGADLLASSQTGSGKTAAFILPSVQRTLYADPGKHPAIEARNQGRNVPRSLPRILVLVPTRELALQVQRAAEDLTRGARRLRSVVVVGGTAYGQQLRMLREGVDLVVATPGRLIDHLQSGRINLSAIEVLVLDEADRMLDMGFIDDIHLIAAKTPATRQTLLFSATLDGVVGKLAAKLTRSPRRIEVAAPARREAMIRQTQMYADNYSHKGKLLDSLLRDDEMKQALVFTATKSSADGLARELSARGFSAAALHGDMHQTARNRTLRGLRDGRTRVLVATDVAARGIDVLGLTHVINFDVPRQAEDYVHRIGRTGRAGRTGIAVTFVGPDERHSMRQIERFTGRQVQVDGVPGLEPRARPDFRPKAKRGGYARHGNSAPRGAR